MLYFVQQQCIIHLVFGTMKVAMAGKIASEALFVPVA